MNRCDTLITGATVIDGTGAPRFSADVAITGEHISAVGSLAGHVANERIHADGLIVAPGFIDAHTHDDRALLESPAMTAKVSQGVTTVVTGNCGISLAPLIDDPPPPLNLLGNRDWYRFATFGEYLAELERAPAAVNVVPMIGHSTLRVGAMDALDRAARGEELERMAAVLDEALAAGCVGFSTGLDYPTASAAPTSEVVALARRAAAQGALYATHLRNESDRVVEAVQESLDIGRQAEAAVVISHHKTCGKRNFGRTVETLALIERAAERQAVAYDVYPYVASSTVLLADHLEQSERVLITWSEPAPQCAGRLLDEIAADWHCDVDQAVERLQPAGAIYFQIDEQDLRRVMSHAIAMIGSDGLPHDRHPHPRLWGTFARVLGHYSRDLGLFSLEQAVHKMSGRTAAVFGLHERGVIRVGARADLVVFDAGLVADRATFDQPEQPAAGIHDVLVNGARVWRGNGATQERPGLIIRRQSPDR